MEFTNLKQENLTVWEYEWKFINLERLHQGYVLQIRLEQTSMFGNYSLHLRIDW